MLHLLKFESFKVQLCTSASTCPNYMSQSKREFPFIEAVKEIHTGKFLSLFYG